MPARFPECLQAAQSSVEFQAGKPGHRQRLQQETLPERGPLRILKLHLTGFVEVVALAGKYGTRVRVAKGPAAAGTLWALDAAMS